VQREELVQQRHDHRDELERAERAARERTESTTEAALELRSERDRVAADAVQKEHTLVVFREQATRDSDMLQRDVHAMQEQLAGAVPPCGRGSGGPEIGWCRGAAGGRTHLYAWPSW
jgi:hypothetical protein